MYLPLVLVALSAGLVVMMMFTGALDEPGHRSSHTRPTPKGGGVGIVAAFLIGLIVGGGGGPAPVALAAATLGLATISFMDDLWNWPFAVKLAAQALAAGLVIAPGYRLGVLHLPLGLDWNTAGWGAPLTALWVLFVTNAVNFMDGMDGLVAGSALIACLFTAGLAAPGLGLAVPALALASGIAGFLPLNWPRARIFMGDVGSQTVGFVLAVLGVAAAASPQPGSALLMPVLLLPLLLDAAFTLVRRLLARERITQAHRGHLYQVAQRAGMPAPLVSAVYWGLTFWAGASATAFLRLPNGIGVALALLFVPAFGLWVAFVVRAARRAGITRW